MSWRCDSETTWWWNALPAHQRSRATSGTKRWESLGSVHSGCALIMLLETCHSLSHHSLPPAQFDLFFFFYCPVFFHSHPVSAGFLPLFKHSLSFLSSFSVSLSDFVKPLVSPCPPSFHPLHRRSALYLSDRLAWAHHSLGIAACPLTED